MVATEPPSTDQLAPVTLAARSEQRKTTTLAISSGVANRPSGTLSSCTLIASARESPRALAVWSASPPPAPRRHRRDERAHQPHRGHHVQVPLQLPVVVAQLVEPLGVSRAGVVDE